jgi:alpha-L-arabinofuranosidase
VNPSSAWIDHSKTLGSAVFVADMLRVFINDPRVEMATFFKLNEPSFLGLAGVREGKWIPNATYHAFELYTRHFGQTTVAAKALGPTFDSKKAGIVPAMKGVPLIETVASLSPDGKVLYVMLINKSWDQAAAVEISLSGFEPASGSAWLLTGAKPDSNTGSELPKVPGIRWGKQVNVDASRQFDKGAPSQISFGSAPLQDVGRQIRYRLPPHSVASLELRARR